MERPVIVNPPSCPSRSAMRTPSPAARSTSAGRSARGDARRAVRLGRSEGRDGASRGRRRARHRSRSSSIRPRWTSTGRHAASSRRSATPLRPPLPGDGARGRRGELVEPEAKVELMASPSSMGEPRAGAAPRSRGLRADRRAGRTGAAEPPAVRRSATRGCSSSSSPAARSTSAGSGRDWRTAAPRPRPRSRCRGSAAIRSSSAAQPESATPGCRASLPVTWSPPSRSASRTQGSTPPRSRSGGPRRRRFRLTGTKLWISNAPKRTCTRLRAHLGRARRGSPPSPSRATPTASRASTSSWSRRTWSAGSTSTGCTPSEQLLGEVDGASCSRWTRSICSGRASAPSASGWDRRRSTRRLPHGRRQAFGKPLAGFQAVAHQLADVMAAAAGRPPARPGRGGAHDSGVRPVRKASAMAKLFATEIAQRASTSRSRCTGRGRREGPSARTPLPRGARAAHLRGRLRGPARDRRELYKEGSAMSKDKSLTYTSYLALEEILAAQRPRSTSTTRPLHRRPPGVRALVQAADPRACYLQRMLEEGNDARASATFKRVLTILKLVVAQLDVIETMTPVQFLAFRERLESAIRPVSRARGDARPARSPRARRLPRGQRRSRASQGRDVAPVRLRLVPSPSPPAATRSRARCSSATSRSRCRSRRACTPHCSACTATTATGAAGRADGGLRRGLHGVALPPREDGRADDRRTTGHRRLRRRLPPLDAPQAVLPDLWTVRSEL